jgi:hypothetical protein
VSDHFAEKADIAWIWLVALLSAEAAVRILQENKLNGQFLDRGRTERRHVVATGFDWIGKEANRVVLTAKRDPEPSQVISTA